MMNRRDFVRAVPALGLAAAHLPLRAATPFPQKPIRLVVPFAPGGVSDSLGRLVSVTLAQVYGSPVVVENRPGASGHLGAQQVSLSPPDGYTLTTGTIGIHSAFATYKKLAYNPVTDLVPITMTAEAGNIVLVPADSPYKTFQDFLADVKRRPGEIAYGTAGAGSSVHMVTALFEQMTGTRMLHVPYKGSGPALTDLISGRLQVMFDNIGSGMPHVRSGRLRALAVTSARRDPLEPNLPTIAESGVPGYSGTSWFTVAAPKGISAELVNQLQGDIHRALSTADAKTKLQGLGLTAVLGSPAETRAFVTAETAKWTRVIEQAKIQLD